MTVGIDGPGKADITKKEVKNGVMDVHYIPVSPGEYEISIKVAGAPIFGSPFSAKISGTLSMCACTCVAVIIQWTTEHVAVTHRVIDTLIYCRCLCSD